MLGVLAYRYWRYNQRAIAYFKSQMESKDSAAFVGELRMEAARAAASLQGKALPATEVDLVVSGGGFKVCLAVSVVMVLQALGIRIVRIAGTSAGAVKLKQVIYNTDSVPDLVPSKRQR